MHRHRHLHVRHTSIQAHTYAERRRLSAPQKKHKQTAGAPISHNYAGRRFRHKNDGHADIGAHFVLPPTDPCLQTRENPSSLKASPSHPHCTSGLPTGLQSKREKRGEPVQTRSAGGGGGNKTKTASTKKRIGRQTRGLIRTKKIIIK